MPFPERLGELRRRYRLRWKRRGLLWRAFRKRRELVPVKDRTGAIRRGDVLAVAVLRDEMLRLPHWLDHHRGLGVAHFLLVDNGSGDGSREFLAAQRDVSLWSAETSYRAARFGMDWANRLLGRHGAGHWCLTLDADELLVYPDWEARSLPALTGRLEALGREAMACLMVELYPKGPVDEQAPRPDPLGHLEWFDPSGYRARRQDRYGCRVVQGGPRDRVLFAGDPARAPVLSKVPLVRWRRGMAYVNSTHFALPGRVNRALDDGPTGALLHTKLLPDAPARARQERARGEHFTDPGYHVAYYHALAAGPDFWFEGSVRYEGWRQLEALGLLRRDGLD